MTDWLAEDSASHELYQRAKKVLAGGTTRDAVWFDPYPPYVQRGEGAYVYDVDGHRYLDLTNNLGVLIHGHAHPDVVDTAKTQIDAGVCFALPTSSEIALAELLCDRVDSFERVRFINTGSEAVAIALKAARAYTGKSRIAKMEGVYHGSYDFVEPSNSSNPENWGNDPVAVPAVKGTPAGVLADVVVIPANDPVTAKRILQEHANELAAVIVDPVPPRAGLVPLEGSYVEMLREVTRDLGALLIYDEVIALRFGYRGSQGRFGGDPDLTALGKIIGGGYPVGAVAGRSEVMSVFESDLASSGTFTGNPLTMTAGLRSMELLTPQAYDKLETNGEKTRARMQALVDDRRLNIKVIGTGSMFSIQPHCRNVRNYRDYFRSTDESALAKKIHRGMLQEGVLIASTSAGFMSTVMNEPEIDLICCAFEKTLDSLQSELELR